MDGRHLDPYRFLLASLPIFFCPAMNYRTVGPAAPPLGKMRRLGGGTRILLTCAVAGSCQARKAVNERDRFGRCDDHSSSSKERGRSPLELWRKRRTELMRCLRIRLCHNSISTTVAFHQRPPTSISFIYSFVFRSGSTEKHLPRLSIHP